MAWAPDYLTLAEAKRFLKISDDDDDLELAVDITAASRAIDQHCHRQFGKIDTAQERFYTAYPDYERSAWVVPIDDLMDDTGLAATVDGSAVTVADLTFEPINAAVEGMPWTALVWASSVAPLPSSARHGVAVTALWGWSAVPSAVMQACRLQVSRFAARRSTPLGVAGSPEMGSELRLLEKVDPDVGVSLRRYVKSRRPF